MRRQVAISLDEGVRCFWRSRCCGYNDLSQFTQQNGTERLGTGEYLDNKEPGICVDVVSEEPLFARSVKYESGCRWPSFTKPMADK